MEKPVFLVIEIQVRSFATLHKKAPSSPSAQTIIFLKNFTYPPLLAFFNQGYFHEIISKQKDEKALLFLNFNSRSKRFGL